MVNVYSTCRKISMSGLQFIFYEDCLFFFSFVCLLSDECVPNKNRNYCHDEFIVSAWLNFLIEAVLVDGWSEIEIHQRTQYSYLVFHRITNVRIVSLFPKLLVCLLTVLLVI